MQRAQPAERMRHALRYIPIFPDMPCMKRVYKDKRRRSTGRRPGTKSASRPADFHPRFGLHKILVVSASGETFRRLVFDALGGTRDACLLGELFCRRPVLPGPAPPPRRAPRLDPPVVCPGFGFDR